MTTATITRTRRAMVPGDPRHGSIAGWGAGCRDDCCRTASRNWKNNRTRLKAYGRWNPWVDAEPVRKHLQTLSESGIGWKRAAELSGVPQSTVCYLLFRTKVTGQPTAKCRPETAAAILAIKPTLDNVADRARVDATGTIRRLCALAALGHDQQHLAEYLDLNPEAVGRIIRNNAGVAAYVARRVRDLYERLSTVRPEGPYADRCRRMAARKGWAPPLAWDEGTIDDPDAKPNLGDTDAEPDGFDPVIVGFAVDGRLTYEQIRHHRPDLIETVRRLAERGLGDIEIAHHLRWPGANDGGAGRTRGQNSVCQFRKRNGIPGPEKWEAVYAYTSRDRERARRRAARSHKAA